MNSHANFAHLAYTRSFLLHANFAHLAYTKSFLLHANLHRELFDMAQATWKQQSFLHLQHYIEDEDCEKLFLASTMYQLANDT